MCPQVIDLDPPDSGKRFKLSKMQAAERQLRQAIHMFFEDEDIVAIHTIASAAHQILTDISKGRGFVGIMRNKQLIKLQYWKTWIDSINEMSNFLKHGDTDPNTEIEFIPFLTHCFLLEAVWLHFLLTDHWSPEAGVFSVWIATKYPEFFNDHPLKSQMTAFAEHGDLDPENRELWRILMQTAIERWPKANPSKPVTHSE